MVKKIEVNISNKFLYSVLAFIVLISLGVSVYATPATMGHSMGELMPSCTGIITGTNGIANSWGCISASIPTCVGANEVLHWSGSAWSCATVDIGYACYWSGWSPECACVTTDDPSFICGYDSYGNPVYPVLTTQQYCSSGYITQSRTVYCCNSVGGACLAA